MASPCNQQLHVVAVPAAAQGHLNPLMRLCKLLASQGVLVTFVNVDPVHQRIEDLAAQPESEAQDPAAAVAANHGIIRRAHVPIQGFDLANDFRASLETVLEAQNSIASPLEALIRELNQQGPPVTSIISDISMTFPNQDVANKLNIPLVVLVPFSASTLLLLHYVVQGDHISVQEVLARLSRRASKREVICEGLSGLPTIYNDEAFFFKHISDDNPYMWEFLKRSLEKVLCHALGIVINSFEEVEKLALATLSNQLNLPIYVVGPLIEPLHKDNCVALWKENETCLEWLDQQPHLSVLYISFGSVTILTQTQFEEILIGLVSSKQRFIWVVRPDLVEHMPYSKFSLEVLSKSHGKGFVVDWAPQLRVLSHSSVGGFLTHCGWNSTIEAIYSGVPMICWPYFGDQFLNAKYIVEEWKVGLKFEASKDGSSLIESCEVERAVKALIEGEEGKALRKNIMYLKEASHTRHLPEGTSYQSIQTLVTSLV